TPATAGRNARRDACVCGLRRRRGHWWGSFAGTPLSRNSHGMPRQRLTEPSCTARPVPSHSFLDITPAMSQASKPRILTGDTPTGKLHLGHYVGSIENRLAMQEQFDCYFLIANKHAFTTRADKPEEIRQSVIDVATDWLAVVIDPNKSTMFVQSEVPAIDE